MTVLRPPTDLERDRLEHIYDPIKAHAYYMRTRVLKGRQPGRGPDPRTGKTRQQITKNARARQRAELSDRINRLEGKLRKLDALIKKKMREEASENRKSKAKKERAAKERDKPKTAAEKAEAARENQKYRDKNQAKLKADAKKRDGKSGGGSSKGKKIGPKSSVSELQNLATRVRGQLAIAKQKLAAL